MPNSTITSATFDRPKGWPAGFVLDWLYLGDQTSFASCFGIVMNSLHNFSARRLSGAQQSLSDFAGKVVLVVNVASKCGLTPQYAGLEALYRDLKTEGLEVLGFPCNQFAGQEPGSEAEIAEFCSLTYSVSFPMFGKVDVNGPSTDPLYVWLKSERANEDGSSDVSWNFAKFLVGRDGKVIGRFSPGAEPESLREIIESELAR
jgi:glutathione peroxidase